MPGFTPRLQSLADQLHASGGVATDDELAAKADALTPADFVADPTGAATDTDDEARATVIAVRDALVTLGLMAAS